MGGCIAGLPAFGAYLHSNDAMQDNRESIESQTGIQRGGTNVKGRKVIQYSKTGRQKQQQMRCYLPSSSTAVHDNVHLEVIYLRVRNRLAMTAWMIEVCLSARVKA